MNSIQTVCPATYTMVRSIKDRQKTPATIHDLPTDILTLIFKKYINIVQLSSIYSVCKR